LDERRDVRAEDPKRLYVDNGAAFHSKQLAVVCAKLGIALIHAKPYKPQGKGKMERWFRTTRMRPGAQARQAHRRGLAPNRALDRSRPGAVKSTKTGTTPLSDRTEPCPPAEGDARRDETPANEGRRRPRFDRHFDD
jgi:transposase InsO family protein